MARPWFIAIAGLMGAGKTTLARGLASTLGWTYLPEAQPALSLLGDLFKDPSRWAFETQTAFLVNKAVQLQRALSGGFGLVLDRTLDEDASIFAEYFRQNHQIDERSVTTYGALVAHFRETVPPPDLVILCKCPTDVARRRAMSRESGTSSLYPAGYLEQIATLYDSWSATYARSDMYVLDTVATDTRTKKTLEEVARAVTEILALRGTASVQADLFVSTSPSTIATRANLIPLVSVEEKFGSRPTPRAITPDVRVTRFPSAYLAAPFTGFADSSDEASSTLALDMPHGRLLEGPYRQFLLSIERALKRLGINVLIPHRDINAWGDRKLPADQVLRLCSEYVSETDLFVGVLGQSHGSHYEFGLALSRGQPCVLIRAKSIPESFIASGITNNLRNCLVIEIDTLDDAERAILAPDTRRFLERYLPIGGGHQ